MLIDDVETVRRTCRELCATVRDGEGLGSIVDKFARFHLDAITGCARSHFHVWERIDSGEVAGLVFEDDVRLHAETLSVVTPTSGLPGRWDVIYLHAPNLFDADLCTEPYSRALRRVRPDAGRTFQTSSYLIHPDCARRLTEYIRCHGVNAPIDRFLDRVQAALGLQYFMLHPAEGILATHADLDSDIQPPR